MTELGSKLTCGIAKSVAASREFGCPLLTLRLDQFAPAANYRFSNWAFGSSSFSFYFVDEIVYPGHASLRSLVWRSKCAAACMCRIGSGEPRFPARFKLRSRHFRLRPRTSSGLDDPVRLGGRLLVHAVGVS